MTDEAPPTADAKTTSDSMLVARLASGDMDALRLLHRRHAARVFSVASRVVDPSMADDVVQEVFLTLWKKHESYDEAKGSFPSWIASVTRRRALNHRRGKLAQSSDGEDALADVADDAILPDEAQWLRHRTNVLRSAVEALPPELRQAVSLAYFDELTHEQVAAALATPLGTTKTRIRTALKRLAPALVLLLALAVVLFVWKRDERRAREEQALWMVTASDVVPVRLVAAEGVPPEAHGVYRARPGAHVAVLTASHLPPLQSGERYIAWTRHGEHWTLLGELSEPAGDGRRMRVTEIRDEDVTPEEIRVTGETETSTVPGRTTPFWSGQRLDKSWERH